MNSKVSQWTAVVIGVAIALFLVYSHFQSFADVHFLGGVVLVEVVIACVWKYAQWFFTLLIITFLWAGMHVPLQSAWTMGRWAVLATGALVGYIVWIKAPRSDFKTVHLIAFFCVIAAFVSASVSAYVQMASFKALSLLLLLLYCSSGIRLAVLGREPRFFERLVLGCEIGTFGTAICYLAFGEEIWGNPNSLGAAMSIGVFPILLWGWLTTEGPALKFRRFTALLLCGYLVFFSMARAGMAAVFVVTVTFCIGLRQYKMLMKAAGVVLLLMAVGGIVAPSGLQQKLSDFKDAVLYKGHKEKGVLGSRRTPWDDSIASIKEHPWFGTGYGTSPTGDDPGLNFGKFASSAETVREHGSSYMTLAEWVGLLGAVPFIALLLLTLSNVRRVFLWMRRTSDPSHYAIPLAMVLLAGFVHASFEDWLFAVGAYPCVYFWSFAFLLADLVPIPAPLLAPPLLVRSAPPPTGFEAVIPNR